MNRTQLEHIIRAASRISDDAEIVVIGSQAVHAQEMKLPPIERADDIDFAIGELSSFHETFGYYAHGVSPETAILPAGWEGRLIRLSNANTDGATGFCLDVHDLVLSKYAAGREKDLEFNKALVHYGCVDKATLLKLAAQMLVDGEMKLILLNRINAHFSDMNA